MDGVVLFYDADDVKNTDKVEELCATPVFCFRGAAVLPFHLVMIKISGN